MKTIDEIVARNDYKNLNEALNERVKEIAEIIRKKMYYLQIEELDDYRICEVKANSGFSDDYLAVEDEFAFRSLEADSSYYYCNDFNCHVCAASYHQKLNFLNSCKRLFEELDQIETKKCEEIKKALENNK
jgi:hypothetical protein